MGALGLEMFLNARKANKSAHDFQVTTPVAYPTGFSELDYLNGQKVEVYDRDDNLIMEYDSVGVVEGTMNTIIADAGLGKTTIAQQFATTIAARYDNSFVVHEDIEQASHLNRVYNISRLSASWMRTHYTMYQDTHAETVVDRFKDHALMKLNNRKVFEYDTGLKDMYGDKLIRMQPSFMLLDSLAMMRSEDLDMDADKDSTGKATNNMSGARNARFNSEIFKQMLPYAKKANIILYIINHISRKVDIGFVKSARDLVGLGENESLPGGRASVYLANNVLRLKNKCQLKPDKEYGINGYIIGATYYKSRTNASNVECELIFDKSNGYSKILTMLHFGLNNNLVKKSGNKYYVKGYEDTIFTKKTFMSTCEEHPILLNALYNLMHPILRGYLGRQAITADESEEERLDSYSDIMTMLAV